MNAARRDAIHTMTARLAEEQAALALCESNGWHFDAAVARREIARLEALICRLKQQNRN